MLTLAAPSARSDPAHYYFFDQARPLARNVAEIAYKLDDNSPSPADLPPQESLPIRGWKLARLPKELQTHDEVRNVVERLANDSSVHFVSPVFTDEHGGRIIITQDLLIGFHENVEPQLAESILDELPGSIILDRDWTGMRGAFRIRHGSRNGFEVLAAANRLAEAAEVLFAEPDVIFSGQGNLFPDDPYFSLSWGLHNKGQFGGVFGADLDAVEAWDISTGAEAVIITIIDSGVQLDHPDLNLIPGTDSTSDGPGKGEPVNAFDNHGTTIAGCVTAHVNNGLGTAGIAPQCRSASARTFISVDKAGHWISQSSWTVNSLAWAQSVGARVTNNSNSYGFTSSAIAQKYAQTRAAGMVHFAGVHNDALAEISYPAILPSVNALAALNRAGERASYSNYGPGLDFSAPGDEIVSTDRTGNSGYVDGDYLKGSGTSFASPFAAGTAALILSRNPALNSQSVEQIMQDTCVDLGDLGYDTDYGWGFVNAWQALLLADPAVQGACCVGQCMESMSALECQQAGAGNPGSRWFGGKQCAQVQCPPAHTQCESARAIAASGVITLDNSHLTNLPSPPFACGLGDFHDGTLWFRFVAADSTIRINTCQSQGADSTFAVYDDCAAPAAMACSEDEGLCPDAPFLGDQCIGNLTPGQEYFLQFSAWSSGDRGPYNLELQSPCPPPAPASDPAAILKNRSIAMSVSPGPASKPAIVEWTALRVRLVELQNPQPPNAPQFPPQDFSAFESGPTCTDPSGCIRWVGPPKPYLEESSSPQGASFRAARLQCTPFYHDWSADDVFVVVGAEVLPSSTYDVQNLGAGCTGNEDSCTDVSGILRITTGRYGDVATPFSQTGKPIQPNALDIAEEVNKFKGLPGAPVKAAAQMQPNAPDPNANIDALDIVACVDAYKGFRYPFSGPCVCPSTVSCNTVPCTGPGPCRGGTCVRTCAGGVSAGFQCTNDSHCPGSQCGPGFCRDACARCRP